MRVAVDQAHRADVADRRAVVSGLTDQEIADAVAGDVADRGERETELITRARGRSERPHRRKGESRGEMRTGQAVDRSALHVEARRADEHVVVAVAVAVVDADARLAVEPAGRGAGHRADEGLGGGACRKSAGGEQGGDSQGLQGWLLELGQRLIGDVVGL